MRFKHFIFMRAFRLMIKCHLRYYEHVLLLVSFHEYKPDFLGIVFNISQPLTFNGNNRNV